MIEKILESAEKEVSKHKVTELEMIVELIGDKPYYSIRYFDISDMRWHIGYSSYDLKNVAEWKNECFEVVAKEYGKDTNVPNNGWIPCSERLPKEQDEYLVTWIPEFFPKKRFCEIVEYSPEEGWIGKIPQAPFGKYTIIAWQALAPYQKGE